MKLSILFLFVLTVACNGNYLRLEKNRNLKRCHPLKAGIRHHGTHYHHVVTGAVDKDDIEVVYYACPTNVEFVDCVSQGDVITVAGRNITKVTLGDDFVFYDVEADSPSHALRVVAKITIKSTGATHMESSNMCPIGEVPGNDVCEKCEKGFFNDGNQAACEPCAEGKFSDSSGASVCTLRDDCTSLSRYTSVIGNSTQNNICSQCVTTTYSDTCANNACSGTVSNDAAQCKSCPSGFSCTGADALPQCANTCNNAGKVNGTFADDNCACDCANTGYEGTDCSTKVTCGYKIISNSDKPFAGDIKGVYGDKVLVTCDQGYSPRTFNVTCKKDKSWDVPEECGKTTVCDASSVPTNGLDIGTCTTTLAADASCEPTCKDGYELTKKSECSSAGFSVGICSEKGCTKPSVLTNGKAGTCTGDLSSGTACVPECNAYYALSGGTDISCSKGDLTTLSCNANDCGGVNNGDNKEGIECNLGAITGTTGNCGCVCDFDHHGTNCETRYSFLYGYVELKQSDTCSNVCAKWHGYLVDGFVKEAINRNNATALGIEVITGNICSYLQSKGQLLKSDEC
jgi:hypothetical protein